MNWKYETDGDITVIATLTPDRSDYTCCPK
jgi:hypothetical protein